MANSVPRNSVPRNSVPRKGVSGLLIVALFAVTAGLAIGGYYLLAASASEGGEEPLIHVVKSEPFDHIVLEQGEVASSSNVDVDCEVKSRNSAGTSILWVIEEGAIVKKGDKLVDLDASALENEVKQQRVIVNSSLALKISAQSTFEQAVVAQEEYEEGTFVQEEREFINLILEARETLERTQANLVFSEKLQSRGFQSELALAADEFAVLKAKNQFELQESKLKTLQKITKRKMLIGFVADIETARARVESETQSHDEEVDKLAEIEEQIDKCTIFAPEDGIVVHGNKYSSRGGNAEFVVEAGANVRERQTIVKLPDPTKMQVQAKINEARVPLVVIGMPVAITIGALQNQTLKGRVIKVNKYAEPSSWFSSSVKEYATFIEIIDPPEEVRTGMTSEVRIFVEQIESVVQIPVQALYEFKGHMFVLVQKSEGETATYDSREIKIGSSNDKMVTIEDGLAEGEHVVLNPRAHVDKFDLPDLPDMPRVNDDVADALREMGKDVIRPAKGEPAAPGAEGAGAGRGGAGAGGPGAGGRGAGGRGAGGPGAGGAGAGAGIKPDEIVQKTFDEFDTDKDGSLSTDEINAMPDFRKAGALRGDADSDGIVTKAELMKAIQQRQGGGGGGGGR